MTNQPYEPACLSAFECPGNTHLDLCPHRWLYGQPMGATSVTPATQQEVAFIMKVLERSSQQGNLKKRNPELWATGVQFEQLMVQDAKELEAEPSIGLPPEYAVVYADFAVGRRYMVRIPRHRQRDNGAIIVTQDAAASAAYAWHHFYLGLPEGMTEIDVEEMSASSQLNKEYIWCLLWQTTLFRHTSILGHYVCDRIASDTSLDSRGKRELMLVSEELRDRAVAGAEVAGDALRHFFRLPEETFESPGGINRRLLAWTGFLHAFQTEASRNDAFLWSQLAEERLQISITKASERTLIHEASRAFASVVLMWFALAHSHIAGAQKASDPTEKSGLNASAQGFLENMTKTCKLIGKLGLLPSGSRHVNDALRWSRRYLKKKSPRFDAVLKKTFVGWTTGFNFLAENAPEPQD